jgi:hypothetical protein
MMDQVLEDEMDVIEQEPDLNPEKRGEPEDPHEPY